MEPVEPVTASDWRTGFDMDIGLALFLIVLAIWMFGILRHYDRRHTRPH